jgi:hypothetical protein
VPSRHVHRFTWPLRCVRHVVQSLDRLQRGWPEWLHRVPRVALSRQHYDAVRRVQPRLLGQCWLFWPKQLAVQRLPWRSRTRRNLRQLVPAVAADPLRIVAGSPVASRRDCSRDGLRTMRSRMRQRMHRRRFGQLQRLRRLPRHCFGDVRVAVQHWHVCIMDARTAHV